MVFYCFIVNFALTISLHAQQTITKDPNLREGKLSNGLKYYIRNTESAYAKIHMKFVVLAGHEQEDNDWKNMRTLWNICLSEKQNITPMLWGIFVSAGLVRGVDINAGTGGEYTFFWLNVRRDTAIFNDGLRFFKDIAAGLFVDS